MLKLGEANIRLRSVGIGVIVTNRVAMACERCGARAVDAAASVQSRIGGIADGDPSYDSGRVLLRLSGLICPASSLTLTLRKTQMTGQL